MVPKSAKDSFGVSELCLKSYDGFMGKMFSIEIQSKLFYQWYKYTKSSYMQMCPFLS